MIIWFCRNNVWQKCICKMNCCLNNMICTAHSLKLAFAINDTFQIDVLFSIWEFFFFFRQPFTYITVLYNKLYHVEHNMFPSITSFMLKLDWQLINGFSSKFTSFVSKPLPCNIYLLFISFSFISLNVSKYYDIIQMSWVSQFIRFTYYQESYNYQNSYFNHELTFIKNLLYFCFDLHKVTSCWTVMNF